VLGVQNGVLIDQYARADITQLAKGNAYNRLQWEEMTVGQALALAQIGSPSWPASQPGMPPQVSVFLNMLDPVECVTLSCQKSEAHTVWLKIFDSQLWVQQGHGNEGSAARPQRVFVCTAHDTFR